ncbi:hypothetical protein HGG82_14440 [Marinomonas sp. M1K-6]|uniref:Uncharacterized protein n=1 Tax=Marinomonas profundi TaxID=2726122 RepID=A0A847R8K7_9GAMM|nr:hypothetical protein [Marinomonas profundi]NLQ18803.1 hypothetical protein [Marinomonas profundi]UDV02264.1 hypothetical protein J8N69_11745 [Marinomonas profundi]
MTKNCHPQNITNKTNIHKGTKAQRHKDTKTQAAIQQQKPIHKKQDAAVLCHFLDRQKTEHNSTFARYMANKNKASFYTVYFSFTHTPTARK